MVGGTERVFSRKHAGTLGYTREPRPYAQFRSRRFLPSENDSTENKAKALLRIEETDLKNKPAIRLV